MVTIALAGNPNCGKSTLFHRLTGKRVQVGNWAGVTVERKQGLVRANRDWLLVDLPGLYSLYPYTAEEKISRDFLLSRQAKLVLNLVDARSIERGLYLTMQLKEAGCHLVVAVTMLDEVLRLGGDVDCAELSMRLGVPVFSVSPKSGDGIDGLLDCLRREMKIELPTLTASMPQEDDCAALMRYHKIDGMLQGNVCLSVQNQHAGMQPDKLFLHRLAALPLFLAIMAGLFTICFSGLGQMAKQWLEQGVSSLAIAAHSWLPQQGISLPVCGLLTDGILSGVGTVVCFLPQIALLFFCMGILEECGYLARAAFLMDLPLRKLGLTGQSFIPMLMGFGCTTPAVMAARTLPGEYNRRTTIRLIPFLSCGAKLPVYVMFAGIFFPQQQELSVALCYLAGIVTAVGYGIFLRAEEKNFWETPFLGELPTYQMPSLRLLLKSTLEKCLDFLGRVGSVIFLLSILIWLLRHVDMRFCFTMQESQSLFAQWGTLAAPVFSPLGFGSREAAVALLAGLAAKEAVVSTFGVLCGGPAMVSAELSTLFTPLSAASFMLFCALYAPCVSALATIRRELGSTGQMLRAAAVQTAIAYGVTLAFYQIALLLMRLFGG